MENKIARFLKLVHEPVAVIWTDKEPEEALRFKKGGIWGCVMWLFASAAKGKTAAFDRATYGCVGGGVGLGFGNQYDFFPGSIECFYHFLSKGNQHFEFGKKLVPTIKRFAGKDFAEAFLRGERFMKSPEQVKTFLELLPMQDIPNTYVVFKPLSALEPAEKPVVISFLANSHQLSALTTLWYYEGGSLDSVIIAKGAGCHQVGILAYREAASEDPRAVVGLTDLFARKCIQKQLGDDVMTFTVPFRMFKKMEENVEGSFLQEGTWKTLLKTMD